ncbi:MAG: tripartite-type tricarboxylate transporter receptor subunit TctC [Sphingobacteriales bacterium]|jgi:tripartite-type tricarboxylate transporter receptor subunit TctC
MISIRKPLMVIMAACIATASMVSTVQSATFPSKGVTAICPWSAGGGTDTILRALARNAEPFLGENITVINKTGGGGAIGHTVGVNARPDGYSVMMITFEVLSVPPQGMVPWTYKNFDLLMRVNMDPAAITVHADAPYDTIEEFVAYAKSHPGEIKVGHSGPGSVWQLAGSIFAENTDIELAYVPYNGGAPAVTALVGHHIDAVSVSAAEVQAQVKAGNLKILGVMSDERIAIFPGVPTMKESGFDVSFGTWRGLGVPNGTPEEAKTVLRDAFKQGMETAEFKKFAADSGLGLAYLNAEDWAKSMATDSKSVTKTMQRLGLAK